MHQHDGDKPRVMYMDPGYRVFNNQPTPFGVDALGIG
jgi:hypothetical protein